MIVIPNEVRIHYLIPARIKDTQINQTVTNPTHRRDINFGDYTVRLFLRRYDGRFILVDTRQETPTVPQVLESAFTFNQGLIENIPNDNVLAVLEHFANEFGVDINIGNQRGIFFQDARVPIPLESVKTQQDFNRILAEIFRLDRHDIPRAGQGAVITHVVQNSRPLGNNLEIQFGMVYCINTESYVRYLKTNGLI